MYNVYDSEEFYVTAPSGIAAFNIGGTTIHSFAGVGYAKESVDVLLKKVWGSRNVRDPIFNLLLTPTRGADIRRRTFRHLTKG